MKVSIITVCLNTETTIADTIRSVQAQSHRDVEHVIIDGGSTDRTVATIRSLVGPEAKFVSERDKGIYDAMNKGIRLASGDLIGFLNSGDLFENEKVISRVATEFLTGKVDACWGDLYYVSESDTSKIKRHWTSSDYMPNCFEKGWVPPHPTFYATKETYDRFGLFDLDYPLAADFEIMSRFISKYGVRTIYIPEVLVRMRLGGATNANMRNVIRQNLEILRALRKNELSPSPFFLLHKLYSRFKQFK